VQDVQSAKYAGMPSSAIATGMADYILAPAAMVGRLVNYIKGPYLQGRRSAPVDELVSAESLRKITDLLLARTGHDFAAYKLPTMRRRIERRINVHQINGVGAYIRFLGENPHELDILFKELLISVTGFFRDPEAWEILRDKAVPELIGSRPDDHTLRVWVAACATGEEAYSAAILLKECIARANRRLGFQIFATDLDPRAIEGARLGRFTDGISADVPAPWLERYFSRGEHRYRIHKEIRKSVTFATQNLIGDPPFTKLDWILCRNLLIYLNPDFQKQVLSLFHYALKPGGLLFLGPSETTGAENPFFDTVDEKWKIFARREAPVAARVRFPPRSLAAKTAPATIEPPAAIAEAPVKPLPLSTPVERLLLARFAPASVVVDDRGEIAYIHGHIGSYLEPAPGQPRLNIRDMAREGLRDEISSALSLASARSGEVLRENIRVDRRGGRERVNFSIARIDEPEALHGLYLVTFRPSAAATRGLPRHPSSPARVRALEDQLKDMRVELRTTAEQLRASNEELKSANEELQSTNEELQSSNEELESSREELQSLNEELTTANSEQQARVDELSRANDDMQNLLDSTDIATIFLDNDLRIIRYTENAKKLIRLIPTDVGRPIADLTSLVKYDGLGEDCRGVLGSLERKEKEVTTKDGSWHLMRIMPYRTKDNAIGGLVITFVNVTAVRLAERASREERAYFESIVETVREPLLVLDERLHVVSANKAYYEKFKLRRAQVDGEPLYELGREEWDIPELRRMLEKVLPKDTAFEDFRVDRVFRKIGRRVFLVNGRRLTRETGKPGMILMAMEDATDR
ncbi:MAG: CheR family methyltransferase, partial [Opitutaceae bacterium]